MTAVPRAAMINDKNASGPERLKAYLVTFWGHMRTSLRKPNLVFWGAGLEIFLLFLWAWLFARPYLNMNSNVYPDGVDWALQVHFNHVWTRFLECGACAMWNGSTGGGAPAFADIFSSNLHPLVVATTWLEGVRNGSKVLLLLIFFMGGVAQWLLARVMGLSIVPRLWAGAMAVVAGNLVGRMQMGWINAALSTAACMLVFPALILVAHSPRWRGTVLLGLALGFAALAGQGYMQLGLCLSLPIALVLVPWGTSQARQVLIRFAVAGGLAFLIAAPFIIPFVMSLGQFAKAEDTTFQGAIHFGYLPLMFINSEFEFLASKDLGMQGYPSLYTNYIGFLPFLFFFLGIRGAQRGRQWRAVVYLVLTGVFALWLASIEPRNFIAEFFPDTWLNDLNQRVRSAAMIAGLAAPAVIGVAAVGVEYFWQRFSLWITLGTPQDAPKSEVQRINLKWLLLIPLLWMLLDVRSAGTQWIRNVELRPETYPVLNALKPNDVQWVAFPPQNFYLEPAVGMGLKVPWVGLAEFWKDKTLPPVFREAVLNGESQGRLIANVEGVDIYQKGQNQSYAILVGNHEEFAVCTAKGAAGDIDVNCDAPFDGLLTVRENSWAGWSAKLDGKDVSLNPGRWLQLQIPSGAHRVELRYRPLDVPAGIGLFLCGCVLAIVLWFKRESPTENDLPHPEKDTMELPVE